MGSRGGTEAGEDRLRRRRVDTVSSSSSSSSLERSCNLLMFSAMSGPQGWADLPDGLLQSIVALLGSFADLLAFAATCPSWRAAFSSYPCKSTLLPPLFLQPNIPVCSPRPLPFSTTLVPKRPCYITDLANQDRHMCCEIPLLANFIFRIDQRTPLENFYLRGASYGNFILSNKQSCVVVDVFTGVSVSPPQLPVYEYPQLCYGALTSPLASPNSHLMLTTRSHHFFWRVGSHSWSGHPAHNRKIKQLLTFKDQVFGMAEDHKLFIMHLAPQIRIQEIRVAWEGTRTNECFKQWLVVCGDMLLMVGFTVAFPSSGKDVKAFRLDLSSEPAKWVKLEKLENCAIFVSVEEKSQPLCCINPERWGGRSNCIYCCYNGSNGCITLEFGEPVKRDPCIIYGFGLMQPMWVVPSMFS